MIQYSLTVYISRGGETERDFVSINVGLRATRILTADLSAYFFEALFTNLPFAPSFLRGRKESTASAI